MSLKFVSCFVPALALICTLGVSQTAFANNQVKFALAKKAVLAGDVESFATADFKKLLKKAHQIDDKKRADNDDMGCDFSEAYYLGHGNGDELTARSIKNWKAVATPSGVKVTFNADGDSHLIEFDMVCQGSRCAINDVRHGYSTTKALPKHAEDSLRQEAQTMVNTNSCAWE